jgi:hypothetical protein
MFTLAVVMAEGVQLACAAGADAPAADASPGWPITNAAHSVAAPATVRQRDLDE